MLKAKRNISSRISKSKVNNYLIFLYAYIRHKTQAVINNNPPMGVTGPKILAGIEWPDRVAKRYREPEKSKMPDNEKYHADESRG